MPIRLPDETRRDLVAAVQHFFRAERDEEIGSLQAGFLLDFVLAEIGPAVYNQGVRDAQAYVAGVVADLDAAVFETEPARRRASPSRP